MALAEVSIIPIGTSDSSISDWVARAVRVLENEDLKYELTPMGTILEGEISEILKTIWKMHEATMVNGMNRVITTIRIDDRRDGDVSIESRKKSLDSLS